MAILGIAGERPNSPVASFSCGKHTITRTFRVLTSSVFDGPIAVANAIGIPRLFSTYQFGAELHPYCRCRSIEPERIAPGALEWNVICHYETPDAKGGARGDGGHGSDGSDKGDKGDGGGTGEEKDQQFENPLAALPEVETHWETKQIPIQGAQALGVIATATKGATLVDTTYTVFYAVGDPVTVYKDGTLLTTTIAAITDNINISLATAWTGKTGKVYLVDVAFKPLMSSAGEIFVPPPMMDDSSLTLTMTRNEDINTPVLATSAMFGNTVNSDVFFGLNPGQVKCQNITCQRQVKQLPNGTVFPYLRVTYLFHAKSTWDTQLLDKGSYYRFRASTSLPWTKQKFITDDGQPRDGLLDGFGQKLADGGTPVFIIVHPYTWQAFSTLNLPQSFNEVQ
jgi:hypothetical protein